MIKISIIVHAFNEENSIIKILKKVADVEIEGVNREVIVIDDCSTDGTKEILLSLKETKIDLLIGNDKNYGKGYCIKKGIEAATGDLILIQDADLEYDPKDYKNLIEPVKRFRADLVIGSRFLAPKIIRTSYFLNKIKNLPLIDAKIAVSKDFFSISLLIMV